MVTPSVISAFVAWMETGRATIVPSPVSCWYMKRKLSVVLPQLPEPVIHTVPSCHTTVPAGEVEPTCCCAQGLGGGGAVPAFRLSNVEVFRTELLRLVTAKPT